MWVGLSSVGDEANKEVVAGGRDPGPGVLERRTSGDATEKAYKREEKGVDYARLVRKSRQCNVPSVETGEG